MLVEDAQKILITYLKAHFQESMKQDTAIDGNLLQLWLNPPT